ncbi:Papain family cysteine protease, putative [Verrucomicrobiia bacterium DG1235]|nr:Papain family cysteine protease, putative [Verrucomicrobiae bacterium DG1235]
MNFETRSSKGRVFLFTRLKIDLENPKRDEGLFNSLRMKRIIIALCFLVSVSLQAADFFESLDAGGARYYRVYVLSANESSLSIRHSKGLSQVALADLDSELQAKYGYKASADVERGKRLQTIREAQVAQANDRIRKAVSLGSESGTGEPQWLKRAFARFGNAPRISSELDLRPQFRGHGIGIRKQRGPSCSVHAIVAALEFQYAEKQGKRINVSERYLVDATSKTLGRKPLNDLSGTQERESIVDEGFALEHVFQAIRGHGLVLEAKQGEVDPELFAEEFRDVNFSPFQIPGGSTPVGIGNLVHVLNAKMPVVVGVGWPNDQRVRSTSLLSKQPPQQGAGHAVTIVGYRCSTGKIEDTKFIFRNSWGAKWGAGGYGFFTYEYLANNLFSAYVVELR